MKQSVFSAAIMVLQLTIMVCQAGVQRRKGPNTLLMKVTQGGGDWTGCLALRGDDGQAIAGLTCTLSPDVSG